MASLCFNEVVLTGEPEKLTKLKEVIVKVGNEIKYITPEEICKNLGIDTKGFTYSYDIAMGELKDIDFQTIPQGFLKLYCCTAWGDNRTTWKTICEKIGLEFAIRSDVDGEYWTINDPEAKWFPENFVFDSYGEGVFAKLETSFYKTKEELCETLNEISKEEKTFEEWKEYFEDNEDEGSISVIERE